MKTAVASFLLCLSTSTYALQASFALDFSAGKISGYNQIPQGGDYHSTSYQRPTFAEVGVDDDFYYDLELTVEHARYRGVLELNKIKVDGRDYLTQPLATHNQFIPAGAEFKLHTIYNWITLGLGRDFISPNERWRLTPYLVSTVIYFDYRFHAYPKASKREFSLFGGMFGLEAAYQWRPHTCFKLAGFSTLPLSNLIAYHILGSVEYLLIDTPSLKLIPRIGLEYILIDYRDRQSISNHIHFEAKPYAMAGLKLTFG